MSAPMVRTRHPGIYKRGGRYVVIYRAGGKQRKESAREAHAPFRDRRVLERADLPIAS